MSDTLKGPELRVENLDVWAYDTKRGFEVALHLVVPLLGDLVNRHVHLGDEILVGLNVVRHDLHDPLGLIDLHKIFRHCCVGVSN